MISCTEFIPAYSELFKFIEGKSGKEGIQRFWNHLADHYFEDLRDYVDQDGIRGCWEYWSHTLNEEAADFTMTLDEEKGEFAIDMHHCPSKGRLLELGYMQPYPDYCKHCAVLYRLNLEPRGLANEVDLSKCDEAKCLFTVSRKG
ncbi:MAG: hypothetical protein P4M02_07505 [Clostridia bacterium]|nr:hypothetical protein [Clostridia bacterium]